MILSAHRYSTLSETLLNLLGVVAAGGAGAAQVSLPRYHVVIYLRR